MLFRSALYRSIVALLSLCVSVINPVLADDQKPISDNPKALADAIDNAVWPWMAGQKIKSAAIAVVCTEISSAPTATAAGRRMSNTCWAACRRPSRPSASPRSWTRASFCSRIGHRCPQGGFREIRPAYRSKLGQDHHRAPVETSLGDLGQKCMRRSRMRSPLGTRSRTPSTARSSFSPARNICTATPAISFWIRGQGQAAQGLLLRGCEPFLKATGGSGTIQPTLTERAPNGGWKVSAVDYVEFLRYFDTDWHILDAMTRDYVRKPPNGDYSLGAHIEHTVDGIRLWHDGLVHGDNTPSHPIPEPPSTSWITRAFQSSSSIRATRRSRRGSSR